MRLSPNKKLCLLIHALSPGGMERVMSQLAEYFAAKEGLEVHLVLYGIKREIFYPVREKVIIHRPDFKFSNSRRTYDTIRTLFFLRKTLREINPECVLSFGEVWNNLVLLALLGLKYPVYISDRSQPDKGLGPLHNRLKRWLYPKAAGLITQTEKAQEIAVAANLNASIRVIGNPIRAIEPGLPDEKENIVLTVGRLIRTKYLDQLIRLFVHLDKPGWKLVIVGGDAQRQNLMVEFQALIKELKASDRVFLEGTQADVDSYYRMSKVFAFTSSSEGFPNVVGEALSAGLPVVSFDCVAGPSEMIRDDENGFLVPVFDYDMFEQKLRTLMGDEALRDRLAANSKSSVERFSLEKIGKQYFEFMMKS